MKSALLASSAIGAALALTGVVATSSLLTVATTIPAQAQSQCPVLAYGAVPTVAQWQSCFTMKQDVGGGSGGSGITGAQVIAALGYTPVNKAGDTMFGELTLQASSAGGSGFNYPQGAAPSSPSNGDIWMTSTGMFARVNGSTMGPFGAGGNITSAGDCTGTASGGLLTLSCAPFLGNAHTWSAAQTFGAATIVARRTVSSGQTLLLTDGVVCGDVSGGGFTLQLPASPANGQTLSIDDCKRKSAGSNLVISANSGQTISGAGSITLNTPGASVNAVWNSTDSDWNLFALADDLDFAMRSGMNLFGGCRRFRVMGFV